ncbi:STAS domain-containing protein [Amycolatopsis sp. lyj-112]|uniref:STAS domain-containing protein n=1 Tax=Amycolatopsis sp. lyj-112 TaxID=2789288 RepID=UPI003979A258
MPAQPRVRQDGEGRLRLHVSRPAKGTAVVKVSGEVDLGTAPRLWQMLSERLHGHGAKLIVNLSELDFFGVAGFRVLERAQLLADERGTLLFIHPGECRSARRMLDLYDGDGLRTL